MKVKTNMAFSGVPKDTTGDAEIDGHLWKIIWDLPNRSQPLVDWFDVGEFQQFLEVVKE